MVVGYDKKAGPLRGGPGMKAIKVSMGLSLSTFTMLACSSSTPPLSTQEARSKSPQPGILSLAVAKGDLAQVRTLLEQGADINEGTMRGDSKATPLLIAVASQNGALVKYLVDSGADIQAKYKGYQAEDLANYLQNDDIAKILYYRRILLEKGAEK